jgi:glycosyltransferase involved in cell wall biosynthesis
MKIGIDCRMYSSAFTGIGRYVHELTDRLFEIDRENEYVLFFNEPEFEKFQPKSPRVKKVLVNARHYSMAEQWKFLRILNREKLDMMHFTHFNAPILYRRPFVVTIHDLTLSFYPGKKMNSPAYRIAYQLTLGHAVKKAEKVIAVSRNTSKDLQKLFKVPAEKIAVIYEGVGSNFKRVEESAAQTQKIKAKYHLDKPYLLYTGVWRSHKNLTNLLEAFYILKNEYGFDGYLVITGRQDPLYAPEIVDKAMSLQLEPDVIFTGLVADEDLIPLYNGALMYVFPSLYEGFGLPPLEAMACGIPVAASNTSCIPEICGEGNAIFFNPMNVRNMAEKIFEVISRKSLREELIRRGLERVKFFSWDKMAQETLKIYKQD